MYNQHVVSIHFRSVHFMDILYLPSKKPLNVKFRGGMYAGVLRRKGATSDTYFKMYQRCPGHIGWFQGLGG